MRGDNNLLFFFLLLCGKCVLEEGEGNNAIFLYCICNGVCPLKIYLYILAFESLVNLLEQCIMLSILRKR